MSSPTQDVPPVRRVTVVGAGLVGGSWSALFLAHGLEVFATDPAPGAHDRLLKSVEDAWPVLVRLGLPAPEWRHRLQFSADPKEALADTDFVQESGPERLDIKTDLFASLDRLAAPGVVIASSSSSQMMTAIQSRCTHPGRCVIGHPINPPHVIPLVEVVGGQQTSPETIARAMQFYRRVGKYPIHVKKEMPGYVANRLQAALWREALDMVRQGAITVADADAAVSQGVGLRWAIMGPSLVFHLCGGQGGIRNFMNHLAGPFSSWWPSLGTTELTPELIDTVIRGIEAETQGRSVAQLEQERDRVLLGLLASLKTPPPS
jgi:3-hydroxyacyl-CoA dehydrogenase